MKVTIETNDGSLILRIDGFLDSSNATEFETAVLDVCNKSNNVMLDFAKVDFVSSAALRVLLLAHKKMLSKSGSLVLFNVNDTVREVFELTGFISLLKIQ